MLNRKAQFFIISTIIITATLVSVQGLFSGYGNIDTSVPSAIPDDYIFNNIKSEFSQTYSAYTCPDVELNLKEFSFKAVEYYGEKRFDLEIKYPKDSVCTGADEMTKNPVAVEINLTSFNGNVYDSFSL